MGNSLRNIGTIAGKELRGYFGSPVGWVLIGLFGAIFAFFFNGYLDYFAKQSMQGQFGGGPPSLNINSLMIRPLFGSISVLLLFLSPVMTMRIYAEEKRSGTIELLLTSPVTDLEIVLGKFLGAVGLLAALLAVTLAYFAVLFVYGSPEWKPLVTGYLGLLFLGSSFIAVGLFLSSTTKNQILAGVATFVVLLMFWIISWLADGASPWASGILSYLSVNEHLDDFSKGIIDTKHVIFFLSFISFGLFLTMKSVDTERWRG